MTRRAAVLALALAASRAGAQEPLSAGDKSVANFAFATQLGSGIYSIDGRTVQIYRLPLSYTLRPETAGRWGLKLTFPMTIGFYDFEPVDVLDTGIPDDLDTVSLVPGLEFRVPVGESLLVKPFLEAGIAREGGTGTEALTGSFGLRTFAMFHPGGFDLDVGNALLWASVDPEGSDAKDSFAALHAAVHARHAMGIDLAGRELEYGLYAAGELYFDEPDFPLPDDRSWDVSAQYEVGLSFGTRQAWKVWKLTLPHVGIGYRFGADASAVRFVIGTPTPVLKR